MSIGFILALLRMSERYFWFRFKVMILSVFNKASEIDLKRIEETEEVYSLFYQFNRFNLLELRMIMKI